jgi:hypothetical protein
MPTANLLRLRLSPESSLTRPEVHFRFTHLQNDKPDNYSDAFRIGTCAANTISDLIIWTGI